MIDETPIRRLTTIVAVDVAGYSRLTAADEEATLAALRAHRVELIDPKVADHRGRIANTAGDSLLIEFPSVVEALRCMLEVQRKMAERNGGVPEDRRITFRVGINLGDVVEQDGDLLGDGVNVAARLEALAEPGGICLSRAARDQVQDRLDVEFEDLGEIELKNLARPVHVFRTSGAAKGVRPPRARRRPDHRRSGRWMVFAMLAIVAYAVWQYWPRFETSGETVLALPDKPSIAVLPFQNMSGDAEQDYFADGMAEDIITDLSKLSGLFVIARNSSFQYRGGNVDVKKVGRELGVRYVLEGSVRRAGDEVRINAQLIDAQSGGHLWAERYNGTLADVFTLQDKVTAQIVASLSVTLSAAEKALSEAVETSVPAAYDAFLAGWQHYRARTIEDYRQALAQFERAVALDPEYGRAWAALASLYNEAAERAWSDRLGIDPGRIPELLDHALERPTPLVYQVLYERLMGARNREGAEDALDKASALDPADPDTLMMRSGLEAVRGNVDTAIDLVKTAMRLDPHYPAYDDYILGWHYLRAGDSAKAIGHLERAQRRNPEDWFPLIYLTAAYVQAGHLEDGRRAAKALIARRRELGFLVTVVGEFGNWWTIDGKTAFGKKLLDDLRLAGIPDKIRPEDLKLPPEHRLSEAELKEMAKSPSRAKGRLLSGLWMRDNYPDGRTVFYWNGTEVGTSTFEIKGDTRYTTDSDGKTSSCAHYRNPSGTSENLDTNIAVCTNGVFPYATFPLPEPTR